MADQSQIRQLQTPDNQINVFPITLEECISDSDGMVLSQKMTTLQSDIATVEPSSTSAHAYAVGDYLMHGTQLYRVIQAISVGDTLVAGTNIEATDVGSEIIPSNTAEGNPINFSSKYAQDAASTKIDLNPIQDLHGYDHPWAGGAGKNLLPMTVESLKAANTSGTWNGNVYSINNVVYTILVDSDNNVIGISANSSDNASANADFNIPTAVMSDNTQIILSGCPANGSVNTYRITFYNAAISMNDTGSGNAITYVSGNNQRCYIRVVSGTSISNKVFYPMLRLATKTDPTFEPYTNICPISGRTEVGIKVKDSEQVTHQSLTISLGQTVYGGTLDVEKGELVVNRGIYTITAFLGDLGSPINHLYGVNAVSNTIKRISSNDEVSDIVCDKFDSKLSNLALYNSTSKGIALNKNGWIFVAFGDMVSSLKEANTLVENDPITFTYPLATPTVIPLTPAQVHLLKGVNNISTDGDDITLVYKNNPYVFESEIEDKADNSTIAPVEKGTTVSQTYSVGQYMMWNGDLYKVTANIANGGTITVGTNVTKTTVAAELLAIIAQLQ